MRFLWKQRKSRTFILQVFIKHTKEYSLQSERPVRLKHIFIMACLFFFFFLLVSVKKISNKVYLWAPFLYTLHKEWRTNCTLMYSIHINLEWVFLERKLNIFQCKESWREKESIWTLKNCSSFLSNHCLNLEGIMN